MSSAAIADRIKREFDTMPAHMQVASRFILEHPTEVALLSMREQARQAGVPAATMTRLAQRLGFSGYEELKALYADTVRDSGVWFSGRAVGLLNRRKEIGDVGLIGDMAETLAEYVRALALPKTARDLTAAADIFASAKRVLCLGARSAFPVAYEFSYVQSYFWERAVLLDGPGGVGGDVLHRADDRDAMLVISLEPYARPTVEWVEIAVNRGVAIVAITDSDLSPVARHAKIALLVPKSSPSFFDTITPAFAASEILMALLATRLGAEVTAAVRQRERQFQATGLVWSQQRPNVNGSTSPKKQAGQANRRRSRRGNNTRC